MCGIAGYISLDGRPVSANFLGPMAKAQRHRGPDHSGQYCDEFVTLGSQRLAIIDVAGGNQPMKNEDASIVVVHNGEIYNYKELRAELEKYGYRFTTNSDTEVLVHAYHKWQLNCLSRLNGMFAFALWDRRQRRLILTRDHLGMKPLYYAVNGGMLWFASEIKSLLCSPGISPALNDWALADYLTYQNLYGEQCLFAGIKKLQSGRCLVIERDRIYEITHWDISFPREPSKNQEEYLKHFLTKLHAAVARHLIGDVEVGCYLSGGYDSTAVALLASSKLRYRLQAFTGAFQEDSFYDERPVAREVARRCAAHLHELTIDASSFWSALDPVCYALDEPSVGCGAIAQYLVAQEAAKHVKVVLTGHGGDELLLGYEAYKAVYMRELLGKNPIKFFILAATLPLRELPRWAYFFLSGNAITRHGQIRLFGASQIQSLLAAPLRRRLKGYDSAQSLKKMLHGIESLDPMEQAMYLYLKAYLPTLLIQEDKMGMAHSMESRMPLCDKELVEFLISAPVSLKLHHGKLKYMLKVALADLYPPMVLNQSKRGFPVPIARWFRFELRRAVEDRLFGRKSCAAEVFDLGKVRQLWEKFQLVPGAGLISYYLANQIYSVLTIVAWCDLYLKKGSNVSQNFLSRNQQNP